MAGGIVDAQQARVIVGEAAAALEVARRRGVHHLALRPEAVRVDGNKVLVTGLGLDAGISGQDQHDAAETSRIDTVGLAALLYYAMTARWAAPVWTSRGSLPTPCTRCPRSVTTPASSPRCRGPRCPVGPVRALRPGARGHRELDRGRRRPGTDLACRPRLRARTLGHPLCGRRTPDVRPAARSAHHERRQPAVDQERVRRPSPPSGHPPRGPFPPTHDRADPPRPLSGTAALPDGASYPVPTYADTPVPAYAAAAANGSYPTQEAPYATQVAAPAPVASAPVPPPRRRAASRRSLRRRALDPRRAAGGSPAPGPPGSSCPSCCCSSSSRSCGREVRTQRLQRRHDAGRGSGRRNVDGLGDPRRRRR
ncbi:hypothetical protein NKG05_12785 [Oerskovia sp. M15]